MAGNVPTAIANWKLMLFELELLRCPGRGVVLEEQQEALNECSTLAAAVLLADPSIYDSI